MATKTRSITSREYKVMLCASRFSRGKQTTTMEAVARFEDAFRCAAEECLRPYGGVDFAGSLNKEKDEKQASVQFLDTEQRALRATGHVFRIRQPNSGGGLELTLKFRHPDRFLASGRRLGGKTKFEEDIKTNHACDFISLYSLSCNINVAADARPGSLKDIRRYYAPLKQLLGDSYVPSARLHRVGKLIVRQVVLEGLSFRVSPSVAAKCALILWYERGNSTEPMVAEFSFRYQAKGKSQRKEPFSAETAQGSFGVLQAFRDKQSSVAEWVDLEGPTKTAYVYRREDSKRP